MILRQLLLAGTLLLTFTTSSGAFAADLDDDAYLADTGVSYPEAPVPAPDSIVTPPGEEQYFPMRSDGQADKNAQDVTVNLTHWLNRFYFNPHSRGEQWGPFNQYWIAERAVRMMPTWEEYDQQNIYALGNRACKILEKYSGYGPGPP